jgi:hypothetical protein
VPTRLGPRFLLSPGSGDLHQCPMDQIDLLLVFINKVLLEHSHMISVCIDWPLSYHHRGLEIEWPTKPEILTPCLSFYLKKKVCQTLI